MLVPKNKTAGPMAFIVNGKCAHKYTNETKMGRTKNSHNNQFETNPVGITNANTV